MLCASLDVGCESPSGCPEPPAGVEFQADQVAGDGFTLFQIVHVNLLLIKLRQPSDIQLTPCGT